MEWSKAASALSPAARSSWLVSVLIFFPPLVSRNEKVSVLIFFSFLVPTLEAVPAG